MKVNRINYTSGHMKSLIFLLMASIVLMIYSCDGSNVVDTPVFGEIVGTICCIDTVNQSAMQGYYIITDKSDSILTFSDEITLSTYAGISGIYGIDDYKIPFQFTYTLLKPSDADYIQYRLPVSNAFFPSMLYPIKHFKQAKIKPLN